VSEWNEFLIEIVAIFLAGCRLDVCGSFFGTVRRMPCWW